MLDVTLAREDTNIKLVQVVTVADVDDEDRIGNSLLQIWKLSFGHKAKLLFRLGQSRPTAGKAWTGLSGQNTVLGCSQCEK